MNNFPIDQNRLIKKSGTQFYFLKNKTHTHTRLHMRYTHACLHMCIHTHKHTRRQGERKGRERENTWHKTNQESGKTYTMKTSKHWRHIWRHPWKERPPWTCIVRINIVKNGFLSRIDVVLSSHPALKSIPNWSKSSMLDLKRRTASSLNKRESQPVL